jgi:very-short-patch-repair endonuclease
MPDMIARRRQSITADEEERMRKGFEIRQYYHLGEAKHHEVQGGTSEPVHLTHEHNGRVVVVNQGPRQKQEDEGLEGFAYCTACDQWLSSENMIENHLEEDGRCPQNAAPDDVLRGIQLFASSQNDVVTLDCTPPTDIHQPEAFYKTLLHTLQQALQVSMDLDESEIDGFLSEVPSEEDRWQLVLYETAEGGTGAVQSLTDPPRLRQTIQSARELLHEGEDDGCERACYECLCSFYNQRDHALLDRRLVLPFLQELAESDELVAPVPSSNGTASGGEAVEKLLAQCQSDFERSVLQAISERNLPLPDEAQKTLYHDGIPIASADFFYEGPRIVVFVDGSPHHKDYVQADDHEKRRELKRRGYRIVVVENTDQDLEALKQRLNLGRR